MGLYKIVYPGVYTPEEQAVLSAYQREKDALNHRGDINIDDLIHGRLPKSTPGVGRVDHIDQRKLQSNYLMPDPTNLPEGCKFSPRCPHCTDICRQQEPPVREQNGHRIKCHLLGGDED